MKRLSIMLGLICFLTANSSIVKAEFDFCSGNSSSGGGSGTFQQQIFQNDIVMVGEIPNGIEGLFILLQSDEDVDIQLYDGEDGTAIVKWAASLSDAGILNGSSYQSIIYHDMSIAWTGYNGDGSGLGSEYIDITSKITRKLVMKAYGYKAGFATVNYSWTGGQSSGCQIPDTGEGHFQQQIVKDGIVKVGEIPRNISNLRINLTSDEDVDIQLYDAENGIAIVKWASSLSDAGILNGSAKQSTNYQGMTIEWSGYNGTDTGLGHEYIKITGNTTKNLTMMAYGYQAGNAVVDYFWGSGSGGNPLSALVDSFVQSKTGKCTDMDYSYGCQCVDLMHSYIQEVLGVPRSAHNIRGNAYPIYSTKFADSTTISSGTRVVRLDKIPNTPSGVPQKGDIIFWSSNAGGGYGHVAIFISGDTNNFTSIDQNWGSGANTHSGLPANVVTHNYDNPTVIGWIHPVIISN